MRKDRADFFQITLIVLMLAITGLFGVFVYRELFPEYKIYQNRYLELEQMRSEETGVPVAPFRGGVQQIVMKDPNNGPEAIDRCVSCHVAMKLQHFSPTRNAVDINGNLVLNERGEPLQVPNENYVWGRIDRKIAQLMNEKELGQLEAAGQWSDIEERKEEAERLAALKVGQSHGHEVDMTRVLAMHPLIGKETRPFLYHPVEEFGCTSCHSGNGRGLVSEKAHGPVIDHTYEAADMGPVPQFLEKDPENDPRFALAYNEKPGHHLLFQTTPLLIGGTIQAKCAQCHQSSSAELQGLAGSVEKVGERRRKELGELQQSLESELQGIVTLLKVRESLVAGGVEKTVSQLKAQRSDFRLTPEDLEELNARVRYVESATADAAVEGVDEDLQQALGSKALVKELLASNVTDSEDPVEATRNFLTAKKNAAAGKGRVFAKLATAEDLKLTIARVESAAVPFAKVSEEYVATGALRGSMDPLLDHYDRGRRLFMSQGCYACHRINGLSRGGVGPELTRIGRYYPWYIKESIVWPQGNLKNSTMPNFKLDHEEVEDLMTFLLAQREESQLVSEVDYSISLKEWEAGAPLPWERPVPASQVRDLKTGMLVYATEGCASCHKLRGFKSAVDYAVAKEGGDFDRRWEEKQWFRDLLPEYVSGSAIVRVLEKYGEELDARLVKGNQPGIVEEVDTLVPDGVIAHYSSFRFAQRAKNAHFAEKERLATTPAELASVHAERQQWADLVEKTLMMFIQEYGFGRDIAPKLHWSGLYRDEEWLVQHFRNPSAYNAKSIMPAFPFDDTKFYALTYMLQELAKQNRDEIREVWANRGFEPALAYNEHCSACHGEFMHGNGPVAQWIYPIPKNLRNPTFLRNLTKERAISSIVHGVRGGPMPPWGEDTLAARQGAKLNPVMNEAEIKQLVDWMYLSLPGSRVIESEEDVDKWQYGPDEFLEELEEEGFEIEVDLARPERLQASAQGCDYKLSPEDRVLLNCLESGVDYFVDVEPKVRVNKSEKVDQVFDVWPGRDDSVEDRLYYIKDRFYTERNISEGQKLFVANCSHCHGKEGGGNGNRATEMVDAKPRMLTNLHWIQSRDDLRLLRSLKYGVQGTSMTPWGDKLSSLQRLQLIVFIRQLTRDKAQRDALEKALYGTYDEAILAVEQARTERGNFLKSIEERYEKVRKEREELYLAAQSGEATASAVTEAYSQELVLLQQLEQGREAEEVLARIQQELQEEAKVYRRLGRAMIDRRLSSAIIARYFGLIEKNAKRFYLDRGELGMVQDGNKSADQQRLVDEIDRYIETKRNDLNEERALLEGQLPSAERALKLDALAADEEALLKLKRQLLSSVELAGKSLHKQRKLFEEFQKQHKQA